MGRRSHPCACCCYLYAFTPAPALSESLRNSRRLHGPNCSGLSAECAKENFGMRIVGGCSKANSRSSMRFPQSLQVCAQLGESAMALAKSIKREPCNAWNRPRLTLPNQIRLQGCLTGLVSTFNLPWLVQERAFSLNSSGFSGHYCTD